MDDEDQDGERTGEKNESRTRWRDCGVGFEDIPTVDFVDFWCLNFFFTKSRRVSSLPLERPPTTFALYGDGANTKVAGQLWGLPVAFLGYL